MAVAVTVLDGLAGGTAALPLEESGSDSASDLTATDSLIKYVYLLRNLYCN